MWFRFGNPKITVCIKIICVRIVSVGIEVGKRPKSTKIGENHIDFSLIDPKFNPKSFKAIPHPQRSLFGRDQCASSEEHSQTEQAGREAIRSELSTQFGKPVYSQHE